MIERINQNILDQQKSIRKAIVDQFNGEFSIDGGVTISERALEKAIASEGLEVFTDDGITKFRQDLQKSFGANRLTSDELEKAKKDLGKLVKVTKMDKNGKKSTVWVKRGEDPKKERPKAKQEEAPERSSDHQELLDKKADLHKRVEAALKSEKDPDKRAELQTHATRLKNENGSLGGEKKEEPKLNKLQADANERFDKKSADIEAKKAEKQTEKKLFGSEKTAAKLEKVKADHQKLIDYQRSSGIRSMSSLDSSWRRLDSAISAHKTAVKKEAAGASSKDNTPESKEKEGYKPGDQVELGGDDKKDSPVEFKEVRGAPGDNYPKGTKEAKISLEQAKSIEKKFKLETMNAPSGWDLDKISKEKEGEDGYSVGIDNGDDDDGFIGITREGNEYILIGGPKVISKIEKHLSQNESETSKSGSTYESQTNSEPKKEKLKFDGRPSDYKIETLENEVPNHKDLSEYKNLQDPSKGSLLERRQNYRQKLVDLANGVSNSEEPKKSTYESHTKTPEESKAVIDRQKSLLANPKSPAGAKRKAQEIIDAEEKKHGKSEKESSKSKENKALSPKSADLAEKAEQASKRAEESGKKEDHEAARTAHYRVIEENRKSDPYSKTGFSNKHFESVLHHDKASREEKEEAEESNTAEKPAAAEGAHHDKIASDFKAMKPEEQQKYIKWLTGGGKKSKDE